MIGDELPAFLTVAQVARLLRVHVQTVRSAVKRGEIPGVVRIGRMVRCNRDALLRLGLIAMPKGAKNGTRVE